jgi:hypothetical protein
MLPELRALPARERGAAVRHALATPFDVLELAALAVAAVGATVSPPTAAAVAALVVLRRTRRALREPATRRRS